MYLQNINLNNKKEFHQLLKEDLKLMRNIESHWQRGKVLYKEDDKHFLIKFSGKQASQLFLKRDLYKNKLTFYNTDFTQIFFFNPMFFWCNDINKNLDFKHILNSIRSSDDLTYQKFFMRKNRIFFFSKKKRPSALVIKKITRNLIALDNDNLVTNFLKYNSYKTLFKLLILKLIKIRIYKVYSMFYKLKFILFLFLLNCKVSITKNKQKFRLLFFFKKKFFVPISKIGPRRRTLKTAQRYLFRSTRRVNFYNIAKQQNYLKINELKSKILNKKNIYKTDIKYRYYFNIWFNFEKYLILEKFKSGYYDSNYYIISPPPRKPRKKKKRKKFFTKKNY